jgi:hypothetical protein
LPIGETKLRSLNQVLTVDATVTSVPPRNYESVSENGSRPTPTLRCLFSGLLTELVPIHQDSSIALVEGSFKYPLPLDS